MFAASVELHRISDVKKLQNPRSFDMAGSSVRQGQDPLSERGQVRPNLAPSRAKGAFVRTMYHFVCGSPPFIAAASRTPSFDALSLMM